MAVNYSYDPIFPAQYSSIKFNRYFLEECRDKIWDGVGNCCDINVESKNSHDNGNEKTDKVSDNIVDLLPSDPFGMELSATVTAITSWFEEMSALGFVMDEELRTQDDEIFGELNLVWNGPMKYYPDDTDMKSAVQDGLYDNSIFLNGDIASTSNSAYDKHNCVEDLCDGGEGGAPHDALFFALCHLGVKDLLSVERVCKSLRDAVQNDPLLWRSIHIDRPLNLKISDDALLSLTNRAQGILRCLSLVECRKITDGGLKRVFESNRGLTKLSVPGCIRLSVEGILYNLKFLKSVGASGIKYLRIGGLFGVTSHHFEELKSLLDIDNRKMLSARKPRFYGDGKLYLSFDDDRAIDIEACPRCQQFIQVYDCPAESCQGKYHATRSCRACICCIARCINCGCCIKGCDYEETFCLDLLCIGCWKQLNNIQERGKSGHSPESFYIFHQQARHHFCFYG